jgi:hypothetical protein
MTCPSCKARFNEDEDVMKRRMIAALTAGAMGALALAGISQPAWATNTAFYVNNQTGSNCAVPAGASTQSPAPVATGPYGGPLPEYWISRADRELVPGEANTAQPINATGSHGWGAVPLLWLHESLLGVTFSGRRSTAVFITPVSAGLPYVQGTTVTPGGLCDGLL